VNVHVKCWGKGGGVNDIKDKISNFPSTSMADKRKFDDDHSGSKRRVIGPSFPSASASASDSDSDSDSDDGFGPAPPPPSGAAPMPVPETPEVVEAKESQRDQWMTEPPSQSDWATKIDPTQLRNRKFNSGKSATAPKKMDASWVETPEERMKRLQDAVMGVGSSEQTGKQSAASNTKLMEDKIKKYRVSLASFDRIFNANSSSHLGYEWQKYSPRKL
jgi:hypothetical protein